MSLQIAEFVVLADSIT
jgi:hypothetical protein